MKVLLFYLGRKGGGAKYSLEIAKSLKINNLDLHLLVSNQSDLSYSFKKLQLPGLYLNTYSNKVNFIFNTLFIFVKINLIKNYIINHKITHVYCTMPHLWGFFIGKLLKKLNIPYILTIHDALIHPGDGGIIAQFVLDKDLKNSNSIICLTNEVKNILIKKFNHIKLISVIPHGSFNYSLLKPNIKTIYNKNKINLLFFGRLIKYKGLDLLLNAWLKILKQVPNANLYIYGSGILSNKNINFIKIHSSSIFLQNRWINENEIHDIFNNSDLIILPYIEASQSGVIGIAHSFGIPVIVTPLGGLIEQLNSGGGLIAKDFTADAIATEIIKILLNIDLYSLHSKLALDSSKKDSWNSISLNIKHHLISSINDF